MRFGLTADVHSHPWTQFATRNAEGRNTRLLDCLSVFGQARQLAEQKLIDKFFVLGDLFHARTKIDIDVMVATWQAVLSLAEVCEVIMLVGNHDCIGRNASVHSLEPFKQIVTVVDTPRSFDFDGYLVHAHPWCDDTENLKKWLAELPPSHLVLLHQGIREAQVGPYGMTGHGSLSIADLPLDRVQYVFAGDFHKRQRFGPDGRVHYIGSPCQLTFGEAGEEKAISILDTETRVIETVPTNSPRFFKCSSPKQYREMCKDGTVRKGIDFVKIECSEEDLDKATAIAESQHTVVVEQVHSERAALARATAAVTDSDVVLIDEYVRMRAPESLHERFAALGRELLTESCDE